MRVAKSLVGLTAVVALLAGVPALLLLLAPPGDLLQGDWRRVLATPGDGTLLVALVAILGWLAWAVVAVSLVGDLVERASRGRWRVPGGPGMAWVRPLTGAVAALAMASFSTSPASSSPPPPPSAANHVGLTVPEPLPSTPSVTHQVEPDDDLWALATRYYGAGEEWRRIVEANPSVNPGESLTPGMFLRLPGALPAEEASRVPPPPTEQRRAGSERPTTITVKAGDTLSGLAERWLGDPERWPEIHALNRARVLDPDMIDIGWVLTLPPAVELRAVGPTSAPQKVTPPLADPDATSSAPPRAHPTRELPQTDVEPSTHESPSFSPTGPAPSSPSGTDPSQAHPAEASDHLADAEVSRAAALGVSTALAVVLTAAWTTRRSWQLAQRPRGRRLLPPGAHATRFASAVTHLAGHRVEDRAASEREPSPATVIVGEDDAGAPVLLDLVTAGITAVSGRNDQVHDLMGAMVTCLACADWSAGVNVTVVGPDLGWVTAFDHPGLAYVTGLELAMPDWERRGRGRRDAGAELSEDAMPELLVLSQTPTAGQWDRVQAAMAPGMGVVTPTPHGSDEKRCHRATVTAITVESDQRAVLSGAIAKIDRVFVPQLIGEPARRAVVELVEVSSTLDTGPAPWWRDPPDEVAVIHTRPTIPTREEDEMPESSLDTRHPVLRVLGPVEIVGARGEIPGRAVKQCAEYCGWILRHPGRSAAQMSQSLLVAEGTRRSNMSRLRTWLGLSEEGDPYLPEAYTGRITLDGQVSSDWDQLQVLIAAGVNLTTSQALVDALSLVRGAPFADAAPGQWHWAEQWRTDMVSTVRDIALVLAERSVQGRELGTARWALKRGLLVSPDDELLLTALVQVEAGLGNRGEVDRLVMVLTRNARTAGIDLLPETVMVLQRVVEGRTRLREG